VLQLRFLFFDHGNGKMLSWRMWIGDPRKAYANFGNAEIDGHSLGSGYGAVMPTTKVIIRRLEDAQQLSGANRDFSTAMGAFFFGG